MKKAFRVVFEIGLSITAVVLLIKNSRLSGENRELKDSLTRERELSDKCQRYIGKVLTEFKTNNLNKN